MKKISLVFIFFLSLFCFIEKSNAQVYQRCDYYDENRDYVVQIVTEDVLWWWDASATIDVYNGQDINGSASVDWDDRDSCPQYIAVRRRVATTSRIEYYVYASNNRSDLLGYIADGTGAILGLNGSTEGEPEITNRCYLEYISPAVSGTSRPTQSFTIPEIVHNISFNFYSYDDGTRDFCVSSGSGTISECQNFTDESPTITITIERSTYSFRINNSSLDAFYSDTCLDNDAYSMQEVDGVYVLSASSSGSGSGEGGSGTPGQVCDGGNCDISLSRVCNDANVSGTLRSIGIIIIIIKVLVPAVIIIVGIKNLFQIIMSGKEDDAKKYVKSIALRVIIGVLIFLLPGIINFFYDTAQNIIASEESSSFDNCWNCLFDIDECDTSGQND